MIIKNAKIYIDSRFTDGCIEFDSRIRAIEPETDGQDIPGCTHTPNLSNQDVLDAQGCLLIPGLVDIHTHGAADDDSSDGSAEGLERMSRYYAAGGVTSWCPTSMTLKETDLIKAIEAIKEFRRPEDGAAIAGINLEGPFLSVKNCGAQDPANIHVPDVDMFCRLNEAAGGMIKLVTVAPEEPCAIGFVREISRTCTVSIGHTVSDYAAAMAAFEAGASHVTHLYNAMPPLRHRSPGVIGAAFDAGATVELITDGLHVDPAVIRMTHRLFGDRLVLISDSLRCTGMPDGDYTLGGQPITMQGGRATLSGSDTLAGSAIHLMDGLRKAVSFGIPLEDAVAAATITPTKVIGMDSEIGSIAPGKRADLVMLDEALHIRAVFVQGRRILS